MASRNSYCSTNANNIGRGGREEGVSVTAAVAPMITIGTAITGSSKERVPHGGDFRKFGACSVGIPAQQLEDWNINTEGITLCY